MTPRRPLLCLPVAAALLLAACAGSDADEAERDPVAFCDSLAELSDLDDQVNQLQFDLMANAVDDLRDAQAVAPIEIEAEVGVVADYIETVVDGYAELEADEVNNDPGAPFRDLNDQRDRVESAGAKLETYAIDECDLDLRAVAPIEVTNITTPDTPEEDHGEEVPADQPSTDEAPADDVPAGDVPAGDDHGQQAPAEPATTAPVPEEPAH